MSFALNQGFSDVPFTLKKLSLCPIYSKIRNLGRLTALPAACDRQLMGTLSDLLYRVSSWRTILLAVLIYALFLSRVMVPHAAEMQSFAGDWGAPDRHFFYTPDELHSGTGGDQWGVKLNCTFLFPEKKLKPLLGFLWGEDRHRSHSRCCD